MRFQFRLQKALHFLTMKETVKRMEVASSLQRVNFVERRLADLEGGIRDLLARHPTTRTEWAHYHDIKISLDAKEVTRMMKLLEEEKKALAERQAELARLGMRKKGLEALRDRKWAEFRLEESRREQKKIDEAFTLSQRYR